MLETTLSYMWDARRGYADADTSMKRLRNRILLERMVIKANWPESH